MDPVVSRFLSPLFYPPLLIVEYLIKPWEVFLNNWTLKDPVAVFPTCLNLILLFSRSSFIVYFLPLCRQLLEGCTYVQAVVLAFWQPGIISFSRYIWEPCRVPHNRRRARTIRWMYLPSPDCTAVVDTFLDWIITLCCGVLMCLLWWRKWN